MSKTEITFAVLVAISLSLITAGAAWFSVGLGLITGGVALTAWSFLVLAGTADEQPSAEASSTDVDESFTA